MISELLDATAWEQRDDARDECVEAVFRSILREKHLDMRDKKAAIVDFIAAGIHTVSLLSKPNTEEGNGHFQRI